MKKIPENSLSIGEKLRGIKPSGGKKLAILLLLLFACQLNNSNPAPQFASTGTQALSVNPHPATKSNLLMCQETNVILEAHNIGTSDIQNGLYTLIIEDQLFENPDSNKRKSFSLEGRSAFNPFGGSIQFVFRLKNNNFPEQIEYYNTPFIFQACYPYTTYASIPVCIDLDIQNIAQKVCSAQPVSVSGGQGAPVAVTSVDPLMIPEGDSIVPTFIIKMSNSGNGRVVSEESLGAACGDYSGDGSASSVKISAMLQDEVLSCSPTSVDFKAGFAQSHCKSNRQFGQREGTFTTPLTIQIDYGYVNKVILPLTITRIPGQKKC